MKRDIHLVIFPKVLSIPPWRMDSYSICGKASTMYGKIEDLVESLKVATPAGTIHTPNFTHDAVGINIMPLFFGSEGTLGIVTEATVKIKKIPRHKRWVCGLFRILKQVLIFSRKPFKTA
ncbi:MAG: FAD-binding oxidoreductase [Bacteroidetes bacterium]|nr:FAD-binding oxidoreductase [Bacteroidota bacterium]